MSPGTGFVVFLAATLALLGCVVATGLRAQRKRHITLVALSFAALGVTIRCAVLLGKQFDLPGAGIITPIHLALAKATTACYLLPVATGLRTIFAPAVKRWHRRVAFLALGMTVATAITGTLMLWLAPRVG
jgi:hypothetical protein